MQLACSRALATSSVSSALSHEPDLAWPERQERSLAAGSRSCGPVLRADSAGEAGSGSPGGACRAAESLYCALAGGQNRALAKPGVSEAGVVVYGFAGWPDAALLAVCLML